MPLPPGLILNPATGELTGTPTVPGTYEIALKVKDAAGTSRELTDEVVISAYTLMGWSGAMGPLMATRAPIANSLGLSGGLGPYAFTIFSGALPSGLALDPDTGAITGAPASAGTYNFVLRATDSIGATCDAVAAGTIDSNLTFAYSGGTDLTVTAAFSDSFTQAGGAGPFTYTIVSGALPAGLSLNPINLVLAGTPTQAGSGTAVVRATDAHGYSADASFTYAVALALSITGSLGHGSVGTSYTANYDCGGGHSPTLSATGLPPGLSMDGTGAVTGTPTTPGTYVVTIHAVDAVGAVASTTATTTIAAAVDISGSYNAAITRGNTFFFRPSVSGGWPGYTYAISAGALPTGLSLNTSTGEISGTATAQGAFTATLRVTDSDGATDTMAVDITVAGDLSVTGSLDSFGTTTVAYSDSLGVTGGTSPYSWSVSAGALPPGLALNTATGAVTGTPTTPGTYAGSIRVTDTNTSYAETAFSIVVAAFPALTGALPDASIGTPYSASYAVSGGHPALTYALASGTLPSGVTLNTGTGVLSGTPTTAQSRTFTLQVTDAHGNVASTGGDTVDVYAAPAITGTVTSAAEVGIAYSDTHLGSTGGKPTLAWSVQGTLPPGLALSTGTGAITGTPTATGTYAFTVVLTDALGISTTSTQSIAVVAPLSFNGGYPTAGSRTAAYLSTPAPSVSGGSGSKTYAKTAGSLPTGTSLNASTGVISGTITASGTFTYTITVTDALGATAALTRTTTVVEPVSVGITSTIPKGVVGSAYNGFTVSRSGGIGPFTFSASGLPNGLSINPSTGVVSGTPTGAGAVGTFNPVLFCTDTGVGGGTSDSVTPSVVIAAALSLTLNYGRGEVGFAYSDSVTVSGGNTPRSYAKTSGTLPPGLSLNTSTGALTGTPTTAGTYTFAVTVTEASGVSLAASKTVSIASVLAVSGSFPGGKNGVAYSSALSASGGWTPRTFAKTTGSLPTGLSLSSAGVLSGTPSATGTFNFTVRVTDADGATADKAMSVVIAPSAPFNVSAAPNPAADEAVATAGGGSVTANVIVTATATGGSGSGYTYAWTLVSRTVYDGAGSFTVSGTSTRTLTASHTSAIAYDVEEVWRCTAHDSLGATDTVDVSIELVVSRDAGGGV